MTNKRFALILSSSVRLISDLMVERLKISFVESLKIIYNSKLYEALTDEKSKMWHYSGYKLYDFLVEEMETGYYDISEDHSYGQRS